MSTPTADPAPRRALVTLAGRCDNRCIFCCQEGLSQHAADLDAVLPALRADHHELTFVGGEPTLASNSIEAVGSAHALGFADIGLQTHGRHLGDVPRVRALIEAGLGHVHLSIHGATPAAHDYHTGIPGSFAEVAAALDVLVDHGVAVVVNTVVTRSNFRVLADLAKWLVRHGVSAWLCSWPRSVGAAATSFDRVMPRLGLAMPFVLHALQTARAGGLSVGVRGTPLCTLGPLTSLAVSDVPRTFARVCEACPARSACSGVDALYLQRFEDEELRSRSSADPSTMPAAVVRRFVGTTAMADPTPVEVHTAPAKARRRLPVLGKPTPGKGEARGRRGKSEGLDRLYPHLFETDPDPTD